MPLGASWKQWISSNSRSSPEECSSWSDTTPQFTHTWSWPETSLPSEPAGADPWEQGQSQKWLGQMDVSTATKQVALQKTVSTMQIRYAKNQFWSITIYNVDKYQSLTMLNFDHWLVIFHSKGHIASISQCKKLPFALIFKLLLFEVWNLTSKSGNTGSTSTGVTPGLL